MSPDELERFAQLENEIQECTACPLHRSRISPVCGHGGSRSLLFIGEGPGEEEDRRGIPFCGRSGDLLGKALVDAGCLPKPDVEDWEGGRQDVFITNTVKCRPPGNRNPARAEMDACKPFLDRQVELIDPQLIVALGKVAAERLLQRPVKITKEHGKIDFRHDGRAVLICYHPAYVLRNQKPEIVEAFYQAIKDARYIAYGISGTANGDVHEEGIR